MLVCKMYIELFCNNYTDWHCFLFVQVSYYVLIYAPHAPVLLKWPFLGSCVWHLRCTSTGHVYLHFVAHTNMYLFHYTLYIAIYIYDICIYILIYYYIWHVFLQFLSYCLLVSHHLTCFLEMHIIMLYIILIQDLHLKNPENPCQVMAMSRRTWSLRKARHSKDTG